MSVVVLFLSETEEEDECEGMQRTLPLPDTEQSRCTIKNKILTRMTI